MTTTTGPRRPPGRYDEGSPLPPWARYGGAALLVVALTALTWLGYHRYSKDRVSYTTVLSTVVSDTETTVTIDVRKSDGYAVRCLLNAVDRNRNEVGTATVALDRSAHGTVRVTGRIATSSRATAGQVLSCRRLP